MTATLAGGGHFLLVIEMISPANATRNISSWKSSLYVTMRITSLRQGSANRLFRLEQRPGLILPSAPAFVNLPQAVCGLLGDPFLFYRFARDEPVQIITRHWAHAAEAA